MSSRSQFTTGASPSDSWKNATCVLGIIYHAPAYHNFDITPTKMFPPSSPRPGFQISTYHVRQVRTAHGVIPNLPEFQSLLDFANGTGGGIALSVLQHDPVLALK